MKLRDGLAGDVAGVPVLLIDKLALVDSPLDAPQFQVLANLRVTLSEIGTVKPKALPVVVITSDRTPAIDDAVKRRCLYHRVDDLNTERGRAQQWSRAR